MRLKSLNEVNLEGKTVLYRSPYDIGVKEKDGKLFLKDDSRIRATLETLNYLLSKNCKIVIMTWVKRPNTPEDKIKLSTITHAKSLSELLNHPVQHINDCVGSNVQSKIQSLKEKEILMLENTRFHQEEFDDNDEFAFELTQGMIMIFYLSIKIHP